MNINKHNYESFFLDYYEKMLSPVEVAELLFFLEENPDLKELFESYEHIDLENEEVQFPDKEAIKKKYSARGMEDILNSEITIENRDFFFAAGTEGVLSAAQKEKLNSFLLQHPELKKEFDLFQQCKLAQEKISFESKEQLKKEIITAQNREEYFVRFIENDLNVSEQEALKKFLLKNPEYKKELELFSKTILPAEKIVFADKESLKREQRKPVFVSIFTQRSAYYATAASVLLLIGLFLFFRDNSDQTIYIAEKIKPASNAVVIKKSTEEENNQSIVKESTSVQSEKEQKDDSKKQSTQASVQNSSEKTSAIISPEAKEEKIEFHPIVSEDMQEKQLIAEAEKPALKMQEEAAVIAAPNKEAGKINVEFQEQIPVAVLASNTNSNEEEYQSVGSFVRKKIKTAFGIKNSTECESASDKINIWDLAMAVKTGIQNKIGTQAIDVDKICDGTGKKVEYVFAAGNFQLSKTASK